jgi:Leucine-rich repeat (LRR) protein
MLTEMPDDIDSCTELHCLYLDDNQFKSVPDLTNFKQLENFSILNNPIIEEKFCKRCGKHNNIYI